MNTKPEYLQKLTDEEGVEMLQEWLDNGRLDIEAVVEELTQDQVWKILGRYCPTRHYTP